MKTNSRFSNKLFVAALMMLMAICLSCIVGFAHITASAATSGTIGLGEEKSTTVNVSKESSATLTVSEDVKAGSYLFTAFVDNLDEYEKWAITFTLNTEIEEYFIPYNAYVGGYTSVVTVKPGMNLTLGLNNEDYNLEVEAYLDNLYIGPANEYWLSGIQIMEGQPSKINLQDVPAGNYVVSAEIIAGTFEEGATMSIQVDNGTPLAMAYNVNMYGAYVADIAIAENSKTLTLATTNEDVIAINFNLYAAVETKALPMETADTFTAWESRTYSYTATKTGYQSLVPTATPSLGDFGITLKTTANDLSGEAVHGENYPIYMVQGKTYFFTVMYFGFDGDGTIKFAVEDWEAPTLKLNSEVVYAPVTNAGNIGAIKYELEEAGTYTLNAVNVSYWEAEITVHYGENQTTVLSGDNSFTANITLGTAGEIYFTTTYTSSFAVGLALDYPAREYNDQIALGIDKTIELNAGESLVYVVGRMNGEEFVGITNGNYAVTLTGANGQVAIYDANYSTPVVANGASTGMFAVLLDYPNMWGYNGETSREQALLIENTGADKITFTLKVTEATGYNLTLDVATKITLEAQANVTYFLEGLDSGSYVVTVGGTHTNIVVYNLAERYAALVPMGANQGMYSFTLVGEREGFAGETSRTMGLLIQNVGTTTETFDITVEKVNSLEAYVETDITIEANGKVTYYMNLVEGTYIITLTNGDEIEVVYNGKVIVLAGDGEGDFAVYAAEEYGTSTIALVFTNMSDEAVTFSVYVAQE